MKPSFNSAAPTVTVVEADDEQTIRLEVFWSANDHLDVNLDRGPRVGEDGDVSAPRGDGQPPRNSADRGAVGRPTARRSDADQAGGDARFIRAHAGYRAGPRKSNRR